MSSRSSATRIAPRRPSEEEIYAFWCEGVKSGFAGTVGAKHEVHPRRPGFKKAYMARHGVLDLCDETTDGRFGWGGDVVIYHELHSPVWRMSVTGWFVPDAQIESETGETIRRGAIEHLKMALRDRREGDGLKDNFAPRGAESFVRGDWMYEYSGQGTFARFCGHEHVYYRNVLMMSQYISGCLHY